VVYRISNTKKKRNILEVEPDRKKKIPSVDGRWKNRRRDGGKTCPNFFDIRHRE